RAARDLQGHHRRQLERRSVLVRRGNAAPDSSPGSFFPAWTRDRMTATAVTAPETVPRPGLAERFDRHAGRFMVLPAVVVLLCFAIFPLIISAYLSLSRFALAPGGFTLKFVGLFNYRKL